MCLTLFCYRAHPEYPFILLANRDEFHRRPTAPATWWQTPSDLVAGRDLEAGGTWMGMRRSGRIAWITNYRDPKRQNPDAPSRGLVVSWFLQGQHDVPSFLRTHAGFQAHNPFNLIAGHVDDLWYFNTVTGQARQLAAGRFGLSNARLDTPWPKVTEGLSALNACLDAHAHPPLSELFALMSDRHPAPDCRLPDTRIGLQWERVLSARFIVTEDYGTRSTAIVMVHRSGQVQFVEQSYDAHGAPSEKRQFSWVGGRRN